MHCALCICWLLSQVCPLDPYMTLCLTLKGRQLDAAENRRLLELDEALHAVDEVLEHKACRLAGGGTAPEDGRRLLLNQRQLMPRLLALAAGELRLLYCRTFQRLVDQRVDGREKDIAVADLDVSNMP